MLFTEQVHRKPDLYPWCQDFISAMWQGHWTPNEFSFQSDLQDFRVNLTEEEKRVIKSTLSAIAQIEIDVKKFWAKMGDCLPHPSINDLGATMSSVEVIHNIAYEKLLNVLGLHEVFEDNLKLPIISGRVQYLKKYNKKLYEEEEKQYVYSLILFTIFIENVSLFSQFYVINCFNRYKNVLKDTAQQVAYTSKEEQLHNLAGTKIINVIREEYPQYFDAELEARILEETVKSCEYEYKIIDWILGDYEMENLDKTILKEFIKDRFNQSLRSIGFPEIFITDDKVLESTEWFYEDVLGNTLTDFFHARPTGYAKSNKSYDPEDMF